MANFPTGQNYAVKSWKGAFVAGLSSLLIFCFYRRRLEPPTLMPKELSTLMKSCFETDPDDRPSFHKIKEEYFGREDWSFSDVMEPVLNCLKLLFD